MTTTTINNDFKPIKPIKMKAIKPIEFYDTTNKV